MRQLMEEMLTPGSSWAVVGASPNEDRYGYKVLQKLKSNGYPVYPVNPGYNEIEGQECYRSLADLPGAIDCLSVVVSPEKSLALLDRVIETGVKNVWFQPRTYNDEVIRKAESLGLCVVHGECVLKAMKAKYEKGEIAVRIEEKIEKTVEWLQEKVAEAHSKGLVVGLSGGIDSSVVAFLIKKAFPEDSMGVILPIHSQPNDQKDAEALAEAVGIDYRIVDLSEEHTSMMDKVMGQLGEDVQRRSADSNLRARLRMSTLYAFGNAKNYLVVGTDNAAETLTGYFTKYGDGGVDLLPITHLTKREVYEWGEYLGVPESILKRPPSAGLWEGQTDEGEMGVTYDAIDDYIEGKPVSDEDREIIERMNKRTEHKRQLPPAPPKF